MKPLLLKLLAGLTAVAALQIPVGYLFTKRDEVNLERVERAFGPRSERLLMGDSVLGYASMREREPKSILDHLQNRMPVGSFDGPGYTPELQLAFLEFALRQGYIPRLLVVSVNMRCFNEYWDQGLQYQFTAVRTPLRFGDVLGYGIQKPLSSYQIWPLIEGFPRSETAYQDLPIRRGDRTLGTLQEVLDQTQDHSDPVARAKAFSLVYLYSLERGHRKVRALARIAALCRSANIPVRMYVTPLDVDSGERMVGPAFRPQVAKNIEIVRGALADQGVDLLDWSSLMRPEQFDYRGYPNEHLAAAGRARLAEELVGLLRTVP
jgi:hypothetical protein